MLLSSTLGQHVGEASADTDTDVVGDAAGHGRAVADRGRADAIVSTSPRASEGGYVRFGSLADMVTTLRDARFTPDSRYTLTRVFAQFVYGNHAATRSISVGSSPGGGEGREQGERADDGKGKLLSQVGDKN